MYTISFFQQFHRKYKDLRVRQNDQPHIYYVADVAYRHLLESQFKQCVVVTGDSGAGKTETTKYMLKHLTNRAKCAIPDLVDRLSRVSISGGFLSFSRRPCRGDSILNFKRLTTSLLQS